MALDIYFPDDIESSLISAVASFAVGQLSSETPNIAAVKTVIAFATSLGMQYKIEPMTIRSSVVTFLQETGRNDIASQIEKIKLLSP